MNKLVAIAISVWAMSCQVGTAQTVSSAPAGIPNTPWALDPIATTPTPLDVPLDIPQYQGGPSCYSPEVPSNGCDLAGTDCGGSWGHFEAGFEFMITRPYFQTNPSISTTQASVSSSGAVTTINTGTENFNYDYTVTPKIWLGWVSDSGLGFRMNWWQFDQASSGAAFNFTKAVATPVVGVGANSQAFFVGNAGAGAVAPPLQITIGPLVGSEGEVPSTLVATSHLNIQVWDWELTQDFHCSCWTLQGFGGIRYAHLWEEYKAFSSQPNEPDGALSNALIASHNFDGAGPTLGVDVRRSVGDTGFALVADVRGSALYGSIHQTAYQQTVVNAEGGPFITNSSGYSDHLGLIGIGECELAVEYCRQIGNARLFGRTGLEAQLWCNAGNASSLGGNLGVFGYEFAIGVGY